MVWIRTMVAALREYVASQGGAMETRDVVPEPVRGRVDDDERANGEVEYRRNVAQGRDVAVTATADRGTGLADRGDAFYAKGARQYALAFLDEKTTPAVSIET